MNNAHPAYLKPSSVMVHPSSTDTPRSTLRRHLRQLRQELTPAQRATCTEGLSLRLQQALNQLIALYRAQHNSQHALTIGWYWPIAGEPDLNDLARLLVENASSTSLSICIALPIVQAINTPLLFGSWLTLEGGRVRASALTQNQWHIPEPLTAPVVQPDVLVIPALGFTQDRYRLGYGGGFYDRTLSALPKRPHSIGVAFECGKLAHLSVEPHDIALDTIVTESAQY